ncbi:MAG: HAD family hydrolase, partial [Candidatus Aenigmatarchaeota archaeon]
VNSDRFFMNVSKSILNKDVKEYKFAVRQAEDIKSILERVVAGLRGMKYRIFSKIAKNISLTNGTRPTISELKKRGYVIAVISDGLDVVANRMKNLDIDFVFANRLDKFNGLLTGKLISFGKKEEIFEKLTKVLGINPNQCAVIGNDVNDLPLFSKAGLSVAYNPSSMQVVRNADYVIYDDDLRSILPIFK